MPDLCPYLPGVALRGKPQLLEKIGVTARTAKTAAQRGAKKKQMTA